MSKVKLGDICDFINGGAWSDKEYDVCGIPVLKVSNCKNQGFQLADINYLPFELQEKYSKNELYIGDVIIATVGSHPNLVESAAGRSCVVTELVQGFYLNQNAVCLRTKDNDILDQKYLGYLCKTRLFIHYIQNRGKGAANQMRIAIGAIKDYTFELPTIETQRRIADILSAYDDLIENNQKQIKLLEEAAQQLYKEWFVDLHFPGWENTSITDGVPKGWRKGVLHDIISYEIGGGWGEDKSIGQCDNPAFVIRGTDIDKIKIGDFSDIPFRYHKSKNLDSRRLQNGDIIFEVSGGSKNVGVAKSLLLRTTFLNYWKFPVMCASFCKLVRCKDVQFSQYLYDTFLYWRAIGKTEEYEKKSASSIINFRWKDFLSQPEILIPPQDILKRYNILSESMYSKINILCRTIDKNKEARDRLLPKLMSGELEV